MTLNDQTQSQKANDKVEGKDEPSKNIDGLRRIYEITCFIRLDDDPETESEEDVEENATWDPDVQPIGDPADTEVAHGIEDHLAAAVAAPAAMAATAAPSRKETRLFFIETSSF